MTPEDVRQLFDYNAWANQRALDSAAQLADQEFVKPRGSSFPSLRDTLVHISAAEWIWLERFHGNSPSGLPDPAEVQTVAALREHWEPIASRLLDFVRGLKQSDLDGVFKYQTINFGMYENPLWQSLQHLANHGSYHRGQVATLVRQAGGKPNLTDLMHFYRERSTAASA